MRGKLFGIGIAGLFSATAIAGSMGGFGAEGSDEIKPETCGKVITLSIGPAWYSNRGEGQINFYPSILFPPGFYHTYVPRTTAGILGSGEMFFGLTRTLGYRYLGQLGLAVSYSGNGKHDGHFYVQTDPVTYTYSYKETNASIAAKGKLVAQWSYWVKPYISASAGVGFNRSWDYKTSHALYGIPSQPSFRHYTTPAFTYTAGIGIQGNITPNWQVGVGYQFADWGKSSLHTPNFQLQNAPVQLNPFIYHGLHAGTFYTQELQFSLSYLM